MTSERDRLAAALPAYQIGEELGRGAFGVVWGGENRYLGRRVAIKQLAAPDAAVRARILAEAKVLASLEHPHVVPLYEYVEDGDLCLLVMERLDGGTLGQRLSLPRPVEIAEACAVAMVTCSGLHHAHQRRVLHRDVKPDNLIFSADGTLKVADFGIAKVVADGAGTFSTVTVTGTPAYMAPEQIEGQHLGPGVDIYATGMMLYELLSGELPFPVQGEALMVAFRHLNEDPRPLGEVAPHLRGELAEITMQALNRLPADRFATAEDFGVAIGRAATTVLGFGWLDRSPVRLLAAGAILDSAHVATVPGAGRNRAGPTVIARSRGSGGGTKPGSRDGARSPTGRAGSAATRPTKAGPAPAPRASVPVETVAQAEAAGPAEAAPPPARAPISITPPLPPPPAGSGPVRSAGPPRAPVPPRRGRGRMVAIVVLVVVLLVVLVKVTSGGGGGKPPAATTTTCFTNDGSHAPPLGNVTYC